MDAAIFGNDPQEVKSLLERGLDANSRDQKGNAPLHFAANLGRRIEIIQVLVAHGATVDLKDVDGDTPLLGASIIGNSDSIQALLAAGADINTKDNLGITPLIGAAGNGKTEAVRTLIAAHADLTLKNNRGYTALGIANVQGQTETAEVLRQAGAPE